MNTVSAEQTQRVAAARVLPGVVTVLTAWRILRDTFIIALQAVMLQTWSQVGIVSLHLRKNCGGVVRGRFVTSLTENREVVTTELYNMDWLSFDWLKP